MFMLLMYLFKAPVNDSVQKMQRRIEGLQEENNGSERNLKTVRDKLVDWDLESHLSGIYILSKQKLLTKWAIL